MDEIMNFGWGKQGGKCDEVRGDSGAVVEYRLRPPYTQYSVSELVNLRQVASIDGSLVAAIHDEGLRKDLTGRRGFLSAQATDTQSMFSAWAANNARFPLARREESMLCQITAATADMLSAHDAAIEAGEPSPLDPKQLMWAEDNFRIASHVLIEKNAGHFLKTLNTWKKANKDVSSYDSNSTTKVDDNLLLASAQAYLKEKMRSGSTSGGIKLAALQNDKKGVLGRFITYGTAIFSQGMDLEAVAATGEGGTNQRSDNKRVKAARSSMPADLPQNAEGLSDWISRPENLRGGLTPMDPTRVQKALDSMSKARDKQKSTDDPIRASNGGDEGEIATIGSMLADEDDDLRAILDDGPGLAQQAVAHALIDVLADPNMKQNKVGVQAVVQSCFVGLHDEDGKGMTAQEINEVFADTDRLEEAVDGVVKRLRSDAPEIDRKYSVHGKPVNTADGEKSRLVTAQANLMQGMSDLLLGEMDKSGTTVKTEKRTKMTEGKVRQARAEVKPRFEKALKEFLANAS